MIILLIQFESISYDFEMRDENQQIHIHPRFSHDFVISSSSLALRRVMMMMIEWRQLKPSRKREDEASIGLKHEAIPWLSLRMFTFHCWQALETWWENKDLTRHSRGIAPARDPQSFQSIGNSRGLKSEK